MNFRGFSSLRKYGIFYDLNFFDGSVGAHGAQGPGGLGAQGPWGPFITIVPSADQWSGSSGPQWRIQKKNPTELRIVILSAEATGQQWRIVYFLNLNAHTWRIELLCKYVFGLWALLSVFRVLDS